MKKLLNYTNPQIYSFGIKFLYPFNELKSLKKLVGKNKTVFEPACGFGRLKKHIHKSCTYNGIDLNEVFINFGQNKNRNIELGDMFDQKNYFSSDIILLSDIIHHLSIEQGKKLISIAAEFTKEKIIILEPSFTGIASGKNWFSKQIGKILSVIDFDGINHITKWLTRDEYYKLFNEYKTENNFKEIIIKKKYNMYIVELIK